MPGCERARAQPRQGCCKRLPCVLRLIRLLPVMQSERPPMHKINRRQVLRWPIVPASALLGTWGSAGCSGDRAGEVVDRGIYRAREEGDEIVDQAKAELAKLTFRIDRSPVDFNKVTATNWYGNTELAFEHRQDWYKDLRGFHSGIDWLVPTETPVRTGIDRDGLVLSVGGEPKPNDWAGAPNAVAIDFGPYIVLYAHLSSVSVAAGTTVPAHSLLGASGIGQDTAHLHLEVILKMDSPKAGLRPGDVRTNPARFLSKELKGQVAGKAWDSFHLNGDNRWLTEDDQPDIVPGGTLFFP